MIITPKAEAAVYAAMKREPALRIVCCWCAPPHVIRVGVEPTTHTLCPLAVAKFEAGDRI
jgi:hypothetical protein